MNDDAYAGEVLVDGNRIRTVARGANQISADNAAETIDGEGQFLMPGMVEGHCHLSFVGPARNQDLGEIPPEEHLLRTCRNATLILNHGFTSCYSAASAKMRACAGATSAASASQTQSANAPTVTVRICRVTR